MALAIFDLDDTLLNGDSASLFCQYLVDKKLAEPSLVQGDIDFFSQYSEGSLAMDDYVRFVMSAISHLDQRQIDDLLPEFIEGYIAPNIYPQALQLLTELREKGARIVLISATVAFIVKAVARYLKIEDVLAIELESAELAGSQHLGYSGEIKGVASFREGKVIRLQQWLASTGESMQHAYFYSDSRNDLPLLELVDYPIATNPDSVLHEHALNNDWSIINWR